MSAAAEPRLLALYPWLAALPAERLAALSRPESWLQVPAGAQLFAEHQPCQGFPLLIDGRIKVVKSTPAGREMLLYRVEPGGSCIISSSCLLGNALYSARGVAATPLTLALLPQADFDRLVVADAAFRAFVFQLFSARLAELMQLVEEVAFHRLDQRLAKLLLQRGASGGAVIHATHQALAEDLGSVREIVSRLLKGFAEQGLVGLAREQITILDAAGLAQLAQHEAM
jgi:CRP/FNR family transcriptional regulator